MDNEKYQTITELLNNQNIIYPEKIDHTSFKYNDINFHIYGLLHGLTGGSNREYVNLVNNTIKNSQGLKIAEKSMKKMYKNIDFETEDWLQMSFLDTFKLSLNIFLLPRRIFDFFFYSIKEKVVKHDRFKKSNTKRIQDLGGSSAFHLLDPFERRLIRGFPPPEEYFKINQQRRAGKSKFKPPRFPDKDMFWLEYIEPYANIPYRSIHMIEYATLIAKKNGQKTVSLFLGDIHHSDIVWYVENTKKFPFFNEIKEMANKAFNNKLYFYYKKSLYYFSLFLGTVSILFLYFVFFILIKFS